MKKIINYFKKIKMKDNTKKLSKPDWIIMGIMVLVYGIISFIRLGDTKVPNTYKTFEHAGDEIVVSMNDDKIYLITAYVPRTDKWEADMKTRKQEVKK